MVDARFSAIASVATLAVAVASALEGVLVVAAIWGALAVGFAVRALSGYRRR